ncbi:MAG: hypothetical protein HQK73_07260, partial [Desulfamplus sp.]|nr:hypothetical protein [Desulfamplus sp.]
AEADSADTGSEETGLDAEASIDTVEDYEIAAAITIAMHLYFESSKIPEYTEAPAYVKPPVSAGMQPAGAGQTAQTNTWSNDGRAQMMRDRLQAYSRGNR